MIQPQRNRYLDTAVQTASPAQLLIMLCDGAIRYCKQGIDAIHRKNSEEANKSLVRVQDIIKEFMITLDLQTPVGENLNRLYEYFLYRLIEANIRKTVEPAEEVLGYLTELKETWIQAARQVQSSNSGVQHG